MPPVRRGVTVRRGGGYEEGDPDAEEGYEEVWDEVQEALSTESARE